MSARTAIVKPNLPQRHDSEQIARWRSDARDVSVTPAFKHKNRSPHGGPDSETAGQDYFALKPSLHGNVISATFTVPHILYEKGKLEWVRSSSRAYLDCLVLTILGNWSSFLAFWPCRLPVALVARGGPFATHRGGLDR
jgi:hypothetical protein